MQGTSLLTKADEEWIIEYRLKKRLKEYKLSKRLEGKLQLWNTLSDNQKEFIKKLELEDTFSTDIRDIATPEKIMLRGVLIIKFLTSYNTSVCFTANFMKEQFFQTSVTTDRIIKHLIKHNIIYQAKMNDRWAVYFLRDGKLP